MTNKALWAAFGFVALAALALPARAEMYEWVDDKGVTHMTSYDPAAPSPAPVVQQRTVTTLRTQAPAPAPSVAPVASARPLPVAVAPLRHVVEIPRQVTPAPQVAAPVKAPVPVAVIRKAPAAAPIPAKAPVLAIQPAAAPVKAPVAALPAKAPVAVVPVKAPVAVVPVKAPVTAAIPVNVPPPVTAQISRSSRTIQVINGNRLSEQQQVTTTSVEVPH